MLFISTNMLDLLPTSTEAVELRLDLLPKQRLDVATLQRALSASAQPLLFTLRSRAHGGAFEGSVEEQMATLEQCLLLNPPFLDVEADLPPFFLEKICTSYRKTKIVLSHHLLSWTPNLEPYYKAMARYPAYAYKLGVPVRSSVEAIECLLFQKTHPRSAVIPIGERGQWARILGPIVGAPLQFACLSESSKTAPGQLTLEELANVYRSFRLNRETKLYGLIGNPVDGSLGHTLHNGWFEARGENKVYVKMVVEKEELALFFAKAIELGFQGFSVTMPLKEAVPPFLDQIDPVAKEMGAVNTIVIRNGQKIGYNTDGKGAMEAIESRFLVKGKTIALLGSGGVARAIAFEAKARGAKVVVIARTLEKGRAFAAAMGCEACPWGTLPTGCFLLINCTPEGVAFGGVPFAMDVVYRPKETLFLSQMRAQGAQVIAGEEMFLNQAKEQAQLWRQ